MQEAKRRAFSGESKGAKPRGRMSAQGKISDFSLGTAVGVRQLPSCLDSDDEL
jgi:hypothetical protein